MATRHKSAMKANRQTIKRTTHNRELRSKLRTGLKSMRAAVEAGDAGKTKSILSDTFSLVDNNSKNGTYVRIRGERELSQGDYVFLGHQLLRVGLLDMARRAEVAARRDIGEHLAIAIHEMRDADHRRARALGELAAVTIKALRGSGTPGRAGCCTAGSSTRVPSGPRRSRRIVRASSPAARMAGFGNGAPATALQSARCEGTHRECSRSRSRATAGGSSPAASGEQ